MREGVYSLLNRYKTGGWQKLYVHKLRLEFVFERQEKIEVLKCGRKGEKVTSNILPRTSHVFQPRPIHLTCPRRKQNNKKYTNELAPTKGRTKLVIYVGSPHN